MIKSESDHVQEQSIQGQGSMNKTKSSSLSSAYYDVDEQNMNMRKLEEGDDCETITIDGTDYEINYVRRNFDRWITYKCADTNTCPGGGLDSVCKFCATNRDPTSVACSKCADGFKSGNTLNKG